MSNCKAKRIAQKVSNKKLDQATAEVAFTVMEDIDACAKIITKRFKSTEADSSVFSETKRPDDLLNICGTFGCKNTGTLLLTKAGSEDVTSSATFTSSSDATEYVAGVAYYYIYIGQTGKYTVTTTIGDLTDESLANADSYETAINATHAGFYPVTIDLSLAPSKTVGTGWVATDSGVTFKVEFKGHAGTVGVSSISFFDEIEDLEGNTAVRLGCLTGVDGEDTLDTLEEACQSAQYDESSTSVERTITAKSWTPNFLLLNPLVRKGDETDGWFFANDKKVIARDEATGYGVLHFADMYIEECGHIYVALDDSCNITDSAMSRVNNPNLMKLNERQFQVITMKQNPEVTYNGGKIYFDASLIGKTVFVSYPKEALEVETYHANSSFVNDRRLKMAYTRQLSDGVIEMLEYPSVRITSFPMAVSATENSELEFSVKVSRDDATKDFYTIKRINSESYLL